MLIKAHKRTKLRINHEKKMMAYHEATKKAVKKDTVPWIKVQVCRESCLGHESNRCDQHHHKVKHKTSQPCESNYPCKDSSYDRQKRPAAHKTHSIVKSRMIIIFLKKTRESCGNENQRPVLYNFQILLQILSTEGWYVTHDILWPLLRWTHLRAKQHKADNKNFKLHLMSVERKELYLFFWQIHNTKT